MLSGIVLPKEDDNKDDSKEAKDNNKPENQSKSSSKFFEKINQINKMVLLQKEKKEQELNKRKSKVKIDKPNQLNPPNKLETLTDKDNFIDKTNEQIFDKQNEENNNDKELNLFLEKKDNDIKNKLNDYSQELCQNVDDKENISDEKQIEDSAESKNEVKPEIKNNQGLNSKMKEIIKAIQINQNKNLKMKQTIPDTQMNQIKNDNKNDINNSDGKKTKIEDNQEINNDNMTKKEINEEIITIEKNTKNMDVNNNNTEINNEINSESNNHINNEINEQIKEEEKINEPANENENTDNNRNKDNHQVLKQTALIKNNKNEIEKKEEVEKKDSWEVKKKIKLIEELQQKRKSSDDIKNYPKFPSLKEEKNDKNEEELLSTLKEEKPNEKTKEIMNQNQIKIIPQNNLKFKKKQKTYAQFKWNLNPYKEKKYFLINKSNNNKVSEESKEKEKTDESLRKDERQSIRDSSFKILRINTELDEIKNNEKPLQLEEYDQPLKIDDIDQSLNIEENGNSFPNAKTNIEHANTLHCKLKRKLCSKDNCLYDPLLDKKEGGSSSPEKNRPMGASLPITNIPRRTIYSKKKNLPEIISPLKVKKGVKEDTFCEGFFISSFSKQSGKIMENSEGFKANCGHNECSTLPAMEPEVIFQYPRNEISSLNLNKLAASICFPTGIKICYEENDYIKPIKNYSSSLVNQYGNRYYIYVHHFYYKLMNQKFMKDYSMHPIKYDTAKLVNYSKILTNNKIVKNIHKKLDFYEQLNFRDIVYIPYCVCLISRYPYFKQMEKCLESIRTILSFYSVNSSNIIELLRYITRELPLPKTKTKVKFPIPFFTELIEIECPIYRDLFTVSLNTSLIYSVFSVEIIMLIFRLILFEQKLVFVDNCYDRLSAVQHIFLSLLYPFQWTCTHIPIMSFKMLKYLQAFIPFMNGLHENLFNTSNAKGCLKESSEDIFIVKINEGIVEISTKKQKKTTLNNKLLNGLIPNFPNEINELLKTELTKIQKFSKKSNSQKEVEIQTKSLFLEIFVKLFQDYETYIEIDPETNTEEFNLDKFIAKKPPEDEKFYRQLSETQMYEGFLQKIKGIHTGEDDTIFGEKIKDLNNRVFYDGYARFNDYLTSNKVYLIKPYFLKEKESEIKKEEDMEMHLKLLYPSNTQNTISTSLSPGNNKEGSKIIGSLLDLENLVVEEPEEQEEAAPEETTSEKEAALLFQETTSNEASAEQSLASSIVSSSLSNMTNSFVSRSLSRKKTLQLRKSLTMTPRNDVSPFSVSDKQAEEEGLEFTINQLFGKEKVDRNFAELYTILDNPVIIEEFINILYNKRRREKQMIVFIMDYYKALFQSILTILLKSLTEEMNEEKTIEVVKLIMVTTSIIKQQDNTSMFVSKTYALSNFHFFEELNFWEKWVKIKLDEFMEDNLENATKDRVQEEKRKIIIEVMIMMKKTNQFKNENIYRIVTSLAVDLNDKEYKILEKELKVLSK